MARVKVVPTLFLLLGTTSGEIGWRLKKLIRQTYGDIPVFRFLWVDTDGKISPEAAQWFSSTERAIIGDFDGNVVLQHLDNFPEIKAWWPRDTKLRPGFLGNGAKQIRIYGRLALFRMFAEQDAASGIPLNDRIKQALESITEIENIEAAEHADLRGLSVTVQRRSVDVFIITSICGGTGSSMTWDFAYYTQKFLEGYRRRVIGVFLLPPVIDEVVRVVAPSQQQKIRANAYAWLKESEYLLKTRQWRATYPPGEEVSVDNTPFNRMFLIDMTNQAGYRLNETTDVFNLVAQGVFLRTGWPLHEEIYQVDVNIPELELKFEGRYRYYSSFGASSVVLPKKRIANYCGARLAREAIANILLRNPDEQADVQSQVNALISVLNLRPEKVQERIQGDSVILLKNGPAIRKSDSIEKAKRLVTAERQRDSDQMAQEQKRISDSRERLLEEVKPGLEREIAHLSMGKGVLFAKAVLSSLLSRASGTQIDLDEQPSIANFRAYVADQGTRDENVRKAEEYADGAVERLGALGEGTFNKTKKVFLKGSWNKDFEERKRQCITALDELNRTRIGKAATDETLGFYDELLSIGESWLSLLEQMEGNLKRVSGGLEEKSKKLLHPQQIDSQTYELTIEAVGADYIKHFYERRSDVFNSTLLYREAMRGKPFETLSSLQAFFKEDLERTLMERASEYVDEQIADVSLLSALSEYYGDEAPQKIEELFDRALRYCQPFWRFETDTGLASRAGIRIIGVEDANSELIPGKYRHPEEFRYVIRSTSQKDRIDIAVEDHGVPAHLLRGVQNYRVFYERVLKNSNDPLHVLPEAADVPDLIPERKRGARDVFALALAFGYIVKIGAYYYFDEEKMYERRHISPRQEMRLAQGRENAEEEFIRKDETVRKAQDLIEKDIAEMGNARAIQLLNSKITELEDEIAKRRDATLRDQYEKEIRALRRKIEELES